RPVRPSTTSDGQQACGEYPAHPTRRRGTPYTAAHVLARLAPPTPASAECGAIPCQTGSDHTQGWCDHAGRPVLRRAVCSGNAAPTAAARTAPPSYGITLFDQQGARMHHQQCVHLKTPTGNRFEQTATDQQPGDRARVVHLP